MIHYPFQPSKHDETPDRDTDDIPVIPDLEEEEEDITKQVAAPPVAGFDRDFRSLRDLEADTVEKSLYSSMRTTHGGQNIDLSCLINAMCPAKAVVEADEVWDPNLLFQEVASFVNSGAGTTPTDDK